MLTPLEFHYALEDHKDIHFTPMQRICEVLRIVAQVTHNSTFGRERRDMIEDPQKLFRFGWEQPKIQTVEEMRSKIMGLSHMAGVTVKQGGKEVDPFEQKPKMRRTK